jgi:Fur family ferric uptake transcriptional regulator
MIAAMPADHEHGPPPHPAHLRQSGRRLTRQRQAIWEALLAEPDEHLSADDVVERVRSRLPLVNASTVYRTLDLLVEEGLLLRTDLGADRAYYEPAHEHPHHHVVCERCGTVSHIHDEALGNLAERIKKSSGYTLGSREITFFGLCATCHAAEDLPD